MSHCSGSNPKSNRARRCRASLKVVDYQGWLFGTIDKQPRSVTLHFNADLCPLARYQVRIGLVLLWKFFTQAVPGEYRKRDVLDGVIAADLIVGPTIGRPQIETFESRNVRSDSEGDAHKSPRSLEGSWPRLP